MQIRWLKRILKKVGKKLTKKIFKLGKKFMKKIHNDKNIFVINNFTLLRFGEITHKSAGDFFDNMNPEINLIIAYLSNYENQVNDA